MNVALTESIPIQTDESHDDETTNGSILYNMWYNLKNKRSPPKNSLTIHSRDFIQNIWPKVKTLFLFKMNNIFPSIFLCMYINKLHFFFFNEQQYLVVN